MKSMLSKYFVGLLFLTVTYCKKPASVRPPVPYNPVQVASDSTFLNPLLPVGPDPWVAQKDSFYYYTHTSGDRIRIWSTKAMSQLKTAPDKTVWLKPATGANAHNIWAPELHYLDGKWYTYYTAGSSPDLGTQRLFVLENASADPLQGAWVEKGKLADPAADFFAIDGTVFSHLNKKYLIWSGHASATDNIQRLYIAELSNPYTLSGSRSLISSPTYDWEMVGAPPAVNEGPEILKNSSGKVFLIYSASGCWSDDYKLGMMTLTDGGDPTKASDWSKSPQPVFVKKPENGAFGPGHNGFFKSPDGKEDWIIYHANPLAGQGCADNRSPRMQKFTWNIDGTPNFGEPVKINTALLKPSGERK
jgi:GH43 family beta-xylosidase